MAAVDDYVPTEVAFDESDKTIPFALAALRRMADLIDAELRLALQGRHSVTRVLGRSVIELWLYANELLLDGEAALQRLVREDADQQARLDHGHRAVWDRLESRREGGIDLRNPDFVAGKRVTPNVEALAVRVRSLREGSGHGGGIAEVRYELHYRWDSAHDVHVGLDLLFRYLELKEHQGDQASVLKEPTADRDVNKFRGWESVYDDTRLLADIIGLYLEVADRLVELEELRSRFAT